jgi:hypothetical protein
MAKAEFGRRQVLAGAASILGGVGAHAEQHSAPVLGRDAWMASWMGSKEPSGPLHLGRFSDPIYFLLDPIGWKPSRNQDANLPEIAVPRGFVTDLASIPRIFYSMLRPDGKYAHAAIIHDYMYWFQQYPKDVADTILWVAMNEFGVNAITITTIYEAVHHVGGSAWKNNARLKARGERRILAKFPDDPRTTWLQWKARQDIY